MKIARLFSKTHRKLLVGALGLVMFAPASSDAAVVVLKEGGDIDYTLVGSYGSVPDGGDFGVYTQFEGLGNTATNVHVDDTRMPTLNHSPDANFGQEDPIPNGGGTAQGTLFKWDMSGLPGFAGATVHGAVVRIYQLNGNGALLLNTVSHHDYDEALATNNSPVGTPGTPEWGAAGNAIYSNIGDTANNFVTGTAPGIGTAIGAGYSTWDATADVQAMANGTANYGWAFGLENNRFRSSENAFDGSRPALFIDYTPVPEPTTGLLLGLAALCLSMIRKRK